MPPKHRQEPWNASQFLLHLKIKKVKLHVFQSTRHLVTEGECAILPTSLGPSRPNSQPTNLAGTYQKSRGAVYSYVHINVLLVLMKAILTMIMIIIAGTCAGPAAVSGQAGGELFLGVPERKRKMSC